MPRESGKPKTKAVAQKSGCFYSPLKGLEMTDHKLILQTYLLSQKAPREVLNAQQSLDYSAQVANEIVDQLFEFICADNALMAGLLDNVLNSPFPADTPVEIGARARIIRELTADLECDHSVGVCMCEVYKVLEDACDPDTTVNELIERLTNATG